MATFTIDQIAITRTSANIDDNDVFELQIKDGGVDDEKSAKITREELAKALNGGWLIYRATMSQSSTAAPTVTVIENTIGNIIWTYSATGRYFGTLAGAFVNATFFTICLTDGFNNAGVYKNDDDSIGVKTTNNSFSAANGILSDTCVEIRVKI
jgi:hypothetical protein